VNTGNIQTERGWIQSECAGIQSEREGSRTQGEARTAAYVPEDEDIAGRPACGDSLQHYARVRLDLYRARGDGLRRRMQVRGVGVGACSERACKPGRATAR
jgi:hypothetical protein